MPTSRLKGVPTLSFCPPPTIYTGSLTLLHYKITLCLSVCVCVWLSFLFISRLHNSSNLTGRRISLSVDDRVGYPHLALSSLFFSYVVASRRRWRYRYPLWTNDVTIYPSLPIGLLVTRQLLGQHSQKVHVSFFDCCCLLRSSFLCECANKPTMHVWCIFNDQTPIAVNNTKKSAAKRRRWNQFDSTS